MRLLFILSLSLVSQLGWSQKAYELEQKLDTEQKAVLRSVIQVFDAMRSSDSTALASVLTEDAEMMTHFQDKNGDWQRIEGNVRGFKNAVASDKDAIWDEPVWNIDIQVHNNLAVAQMDYAFFLGKQKLHCGSDVMLLQKVSGRWLIYHLSDTRVVENCQVPEALLKGRQ